MTIIYDSNGKRSLTPAEEAAHVIQQEAAAVKSVSLFRESRREEFRAVAGSKISALFGGKVSNALELAQLNALARMGVILREELNGTLTNSAELDALQALNAQKDAVRAAENTASASLDLAGNDTQQTPSQRKAEIDAVPDPVWP